MNLQIRRQTINERQITKQLEDIQQIYYQKAPPLKSLPTIVKSNKNSTYNLFQPRSSTVVKLKDQAPSTDRKRAITIQNNYSMPNKKIQFEKISDHSESYSSSCYSESSGVSFKYNQQRYGIKLIKSGKKSFIQQPLVKDVPKIVQTSPTLKIIQKSDKKMPLSFFEKNQKFNHQLINKWMSDENAQNIMLSYFNILQHAQIRNYLLKLLEFKPYLKEIFINSNSSIMSISFDIDYETLCNRVFSMNLYESYVRSQFNLNQIQQNRLIQKQLRMTQKTNIAQYDSLKKKLIIPSCHEFIKDILLPNIQQQTEDLQNYITKNKTEGIFNLGRDLMIRRQEVEELEKSSIDRFKTKKNYNQLFQQIKNIQTNIGFLQQNMDEGKILDNIEKVIENQNNIRLKKFDRQKIYTKSRNVYKAIENVIKKVKSQQETKKTLQN